MTRTKALDAIDRDGILIVYPIRNERDPPSLWHRLYPRSQMIWDWAETADPRVANLWHLRTELSESRDVVYAKWYQGRATFFSREVFTALLKIMDAHAGERALTAEAAQLYQLLLDDSPQTPKPLRAALGLEGREYETIFTRALRQLWQRLLAVGFGEVDDGNFPALAIGATRHLFEGLWLEAQALTDAAATAALEARVKPDSLFHKHVLRQKRRLRA